MNAHYTYTSTPNKTIMNDRKSTVLAFLLIIGVFIIMLITVRIASAKPSDTPRTPRMSPLTVQALKQPTLKEVSDIPMVTTTVSGDSFQPAYGDIQGVQAVSQ